MLGYSFSANNGIKTDELYLGASLNAGRCSSKWLQYCTGGSTRPPLMPQGYVFWNMKGKVSFEKSD